MDRREAARLLRRELTSYAKRSRADLTDLIGRVEAHWDGEPGGTINVLGSIDDGGFRSSFNPTTDDFLMDVNGVVDMADPEASG